MANEPCDELDDLIDRAVRSYLAEPRRGLEARIVNRIRARRAHPLAWAAVAAAVAMISLALLPLRAPEAITILVRQPAVPNFPGASKTSTRSLRSPAHHGPALAHLDIFPTPSPLSPEELAALDLAEHHPEDAKVIDPRPIEIAPLEIEPLTMDGGF